MATRARSGDGAQYKEKSGLWAVAIELPPVRWKDDGTPHRNRKVVRFKSKREADAALRELREQKRQMGTLPTNAPTVTVWFEKWLRVQVRPNKRPKTSATYEQYVRSYIVPALGGETKLNKLTPDSIRNIEAFIVQQGLAPSTAVNAYHYAAKALDFAVREGVMFVNPARKVDPPLRNVPDLDVFSLADALKLLQHLATHPDRALWATYLLTGARRGEIAGLELDRMGEDLDLSWQLQRLPFAHGCGGDCGRARPGSCPQRHIVKPNNYEVRDVSGGLFLTRPKSRSGWRIVPLVEPLRSILVRHASTAPENPWGLLFPSTHKLSGKPIPPDPDRITKEWPKLRDEVFGPGRRVRLHDVRHTTVDLLYLAGVPEDLISEIVGHSQRSMTRQYKSRSDITRLRGAMDKLSVLFTQPETERTREIAS